MLIVYRRDPSHPKFVVPEAMVRSLLRIHHDEVAHCGAKKTFYGLSANYWFKSMRRRIKRYIENCVTCIMSNVSSNTNEGELQVAYI